VLRELTTSLRSTLGVLIAALAASGCAIVRPGPPPAIAHELDTLSGPEVAQYGEVFLKVLSDALAEDAYVCTPPPHAVFFGDAPAGARVVEGVMPHYGVFLAPMHYAVRRSASRWRVELRLVIDPPSPDELLELADCETARLLDGASACKPSLAPSFASDDFCPEAPIATAPATRANVERLLAHWSTGVERYYNRDAARFGLPIEYDFEFILESDPPSQKRSDGSFALRAGCGRRPYIMGLDSGWSLPILAHEVGHMLGLLDEFENVGEMIGLGYKTPSGLETSRMGESRRDDTMILPLHHYLVLRRYFCPEPTTRDPYSHAF
jgi:hypothetical protein